MNLLNKEEASRPHTLAGHFLPRPSEFLLPAELLLTGLTRTYSANPLSPDKIISTGQISTEAEGEEKPPALRAVTRTGGQGDRQL